MVLFLGRTHYGTYYSLFFITLFKVLCFFSSILFIKKICLTRRMVYTSRLGQNCSVVENITIKRVRLPQGHLKLHRSNETIQA